MKLRKFATWTGALVAAAVAVGIVTNFSDIIRYVRITRM